MSLPFANICDDLKGRFHTVLVHLASLYGLDIVLAGESQNVEGIVASDRNKLPAIRPVDLILVSHALYQAEHF